MREKRVNEERDKQSNDFPKVPRKKPYKGPQVVDYGHVSRLTAGSTGTHSDKGMAGGAHGNG
jgi:hypothetical protein